MTREEIEQLELECCPFTLVDGPNGTAMMVWKNENHTLATFPSMEVAKAFIIGSDFPRRPGWDRSNIEVDVKGALKRHRERTGAFPTFEFDASHTVLDLYEPLGLATEFVARLVYYEVSAVSEDPDPDDAGGWGAMISRLLIAEGLDRETAERAAWDVTKLMFRVVEAIEKLEQLYRSGGLPEQPAEEMGKPQLN